MITNDWSIQSDNYQRSMQWSPIFCVANLTTISATCNDHQWLVYPIWQLSAHHAMLTNVWSIHSDNYQRNMQWSPIFGVANLTTISASCNDHQCLVYPLWQLSAQHAMITNVSCSQSGSHQHSSVQWSPMFGLSHLTTISAACNDHQYLV